MSASATAARRTASRRIAALECAIAQPASLGVTGSDPPAHFGHELLVVELLDLAWFQRGAELDVNRRRHR
jgi:hypothetical protein